MQVRHILLVFISSFLSCQKNKPTARIYAYTESIFQVTTPENFIPQFDRIQHYESDSGEFITIFTRSSNELHFINLDTKEFHSKVKFPEDGPNGTGLVNGFHLISQDCLMLASIPPRIKLFNLEGEKKATIPVIDSLNKVDWLGSTNMVPFLFDGKTLFGTQPFFTDIYQTTQKEASSSRPFYKLNLGEFSKMVKWLPISRPEDEWKNGKISPNIAWADRGDSIIISPISDHRLWIVSKKNQRLLGYRETPTSSIKKFRILSEYPVGDLEIIKGLESGYYDMILYDKYRGVFYRFFFPPVFVDNYEQTPWELKSNKPKIGVLVLDHNLEVIGEKVFSSHQIETWNYFVGRKGLYVSTNNPNRNDFDENFLRYEIVRFEGLDYED